MLPYEQKVPKSGFGSFKPLGWLHLQQALHLFKYSQFSHKTTSLKLDTIRPRFSCRTKPIIISISYNLWTPTLIFRTQSRIPMLTISTKSYNWLPAMSAILCSTWIRKHTNFKTSAVFTNFSHYLPSYSKFYTLRTLSRLPHHYEQAF